MYFSQFICPILCVVALSQRICKHNDRGSRGISLTMEKNSQVTQTLLFHPSSAPSLSVSSAEGTQSYYLCDLASPSSGATLFHSRFLLLFRNFQSTDTRGLNDHPSLSIYTSLWFYMQSEGIFFQLHWMTVQQAECGGVTQSGKNEFLKRWSKL